jgi:hypothetical protein
VRFGQLDLRRADFTSLLLSKHDTRFTLEAERRPVEDIALHWSEPDRATTVGFPLDIIFVPDDL